MTTTKEETERRHYLEVLRIAEELQRALDEKTERLEKIERALEWATNNGYVVMHSDCWEYRGNREFFNDNSANALIALHERSE